MLSPDVIQIAPRRGGMSSKLMFAEGDIPRCHPNYRLVRRVPSKLSLDQEGAILRCNLNYGSVKKVPCHSKMSHEACHNFEWHEESII
ncbi:hypothetical protein CDAR_436721 [Caerostris darwini]|uniref:Protein Wnt n=1 Tax=Caerostris darwini TaxID=1538125 RepID=A0AAV4SCD5_9ARAC|nr:hypothetical protein CDAR_436721 [Caerostris darwini]